MKKVVLFLVIYILYTYGCSSHVSPPPENKVIEALDRAIGMDKVEKSQNPSKKVTNEIFVIIDASKSMKGFLGAPGYKRGLTEYCSCIRTLQASLDAREIPARYFIFGEEIREINKRYVERALRYQSFYNADFTRLDNLLRKICYSETTSKIPKAIVIITDGVISTPDRADYRRIIGELSRWVGKGNNFEILALKSYYYGSAYSEDLGRIVGKYNGYRPFYLFVLSPKLHFGIGLVNWLRQSGISVDIKYVNLSAPLFISKSVQLKVPGKTTYGRKNILSNYDCSQSVKYLYWVQKNNSANDGEIEVNSIIRPRIPGSEFTINVSAQTIELISYATPLDQDSNLVLIPSVELRNAYYSYAGNNIIKIKFNIGISPLNTKGWNAYNLAIKLKPGAIVLPTWINSYSTNSDTRVVNYGKTYRLEELIRSILLNPRYEQEITSVYLAIKE